MRRMHRIVLLAVIVAITPVLAGCEDFDPDKLDFFHLNEKKKLPGERKELFPGGVPGVTQGIPPEYLKENQPVDAALTATPAASAPGGNAAAPAQPAKTASVAPAVEPKLKPKPKPKPKRKPKPQTASRAPTQITVRPGPAQPAQGLAPWPAGSQPASKQTVAPWPATPPSTAPAQWPAPPPPGTFSQQRN